MASTVTHLVADQVISNTVGEVSRAVGKLKQCGGDHHEITHHTHHPPHRQRLNTEDDEESIVKNRARLKQKHRRMETKREKMRQNIRAKYDIKQTERHRLMLGGSRNAFHEAADEELVANESEDEDQCCCCCFAFSKKGKRSKTKTKHDY